MQISQFDEQNLNWSEKPSNIQQHYYRTYSRLKGIFSENELENNPFDEDENSMSIRQVYKLGSTVSDNWFLGLVPKSEVSGATTISPQAYKMYQELKNIWLNQSKEEVEDEERPFITALRKFVEIYGSEAIEPLKIFVGSNNRNEILASEILEMLGDISNPTVYEPVRSVLEENLVSLDARIRYGAVLGIGNLGSNRSINSLNKALKNEKDSLISAVIKSTINLLKE